jgi:predicted DNA-binding transcriptional regulator YafY
MFVYTFGEVMCVELNRYVGQKVEIMYVNKQGAITQRYIEVRSIKNNYVCAYCFAQKGLRAFKPDNILAIVPAKRWSV